MESNSKQVSLKAGQREGHSPLIRQRGFVPANLYGHGLKNVNLEVELKQLTRAYSQAGSTSLVNLTIENDKKATQHAILIREMQTHPVNSSILHVDFYQVKMDEEIRADVPLRFIGESAAVKDFGGVLVRSMNEVDLEALPLDLPREIEVDISVIKDFDSVIHIKDLSLPANVTLHHDPNDVVATVQPPRTEAEMEALEAEVSTDVSGVEGVADKPLAEGEGKAKPAAGEAESEAKDSVARKPE